MLLRKFIRRHTLDGSGRDGEIFSLPLWALVLGPLSPQRFGWPAHVLAEAQMVDLYTTVYNTGHVDELQRLPSRPSKEELDELMG